MQEATVSEGSLADALEREHRQIDNGIDEFLGSAETDPRALAALTGAMDGLRRHIYLEEEFLFPALREAGLMAPVFVMLREHGQLWQTMEKIDAALPPAGDGSGVVGTCRELVAQLDAHNSKEEPILYPHADRVLTGATGEQFAEFLASGRMPTGWTAERVR
jgi:hemerythrin-like domain-containing protein